jgi:polyisoprenoid-binding protein YceI
MTPPALRALLEEGALAGVWVMDPHRSSIGLEAWHLRSLGQVNGVFHDLSGHATISPDGEVTGTVTVAAASIDTKNARRDTHLRSKAFLESDTYPDITYRVDRIELSGHSVVLTGTVTVRDCTRPLSIDASASLDGDGEFSLDAEMEINRAYVGLSWNVLGIPSMNVVLTIHAVLTRGETDERSIGSTHERTLWT